MYDTRLQPAPNQTTIAIDSRASCKAIADRTITSNTIVKEISDLHNVTSRTNNLIPDTVHEEKLPPGAKPKITKKYQTSKTTDNKIKKKDNTNCTQPRKGRKNAKKGSTTNSSTIMSKTNEGLDHCVICGIYCNDNSIECTNCNQWLHYACLEIDAKLLAEYELNPDCPFTCPSCVHLNNSDMTRMAASQIVIQTKSTVNESEIHLGTTAHSTESLHTPSTDIIKGIPHVDGSACSNKLTDMPTHIVESSYNNDSTDGTPHTDIVACSTSNSLPTTTRNTDYNEEETRLKKWEKKLTQLEKETQKKIKELADKSKQLAHTQSYMTKLETKINKLEENERLYKIQLAAQPNQQQPNKGPSLGSQQIETNSHNMATTNQCTSTHCSQRTEANGSQSPMANIHVLPVNSQCACTSTQSLGTQRCHMAYTSCLQMSHGADNEYTRISTRLNALELDIIKQRITSIECQAKDSNNYKSIVQHQGQSSVQPNSLSNPQLYTTQASNSQDVHSSQRIPQLSTPASRHLINDHPSNEHLERRHSTTSYPTFLNGHPTHSQFAVNKHPITGYPVNESHTKGHRIYGYPTNTQPMIEQQLFGYPMSRPLLNVQRMYGHPANRYPVSVHQTHNNAHSLRSDLPVSGYTTCTSNMASHPVYPVGSHMNEHQVRGHPGLNKYSRNPPTVNQLHSQHWSKHPVTEYPVSGHPMNEHVLNGHQMNNHLLRRYSVQRNGDFSIQQSPYPRQPSLSGHSISTPTPLHQLQSVLGQPRFSPHPVTTITNAQCVTESTKSHHWLPRDTKRRNTTNNNYNCRKPSNDEGVSTSQEKLTHLEISSCLKPSDSIKQHNQNPPVKQSSSNQANPTMVNNDLGSTVETRIQNKSNHDKTIVTTNTTDVDESKISTTPEIINDSFSDTLSIKPPTDVNSTGNTQPFLEHGRASTLWDILQPTHLNLKHSR